MMASRATTLSPGEPAWQSWKLPMKLVKVDLSVKPLAELTDKSANMRQGDMQLNSIFISSVLVLFLFTKFLGFLHGLCPGSPSILSFSEHTSTGPLVQLWEYQSSQQWNRNKPHSSSFLFYLEQVVFAIHRLKNGTHTITHFIHLCLPTPSKRQTSHPILPRQKLGK